MFSPKIFSEFNHTDYTINNLKIFCDEVIDQMPTELVPLFENNKLLQGAMTVYIYEYGEQDYNFEADKFSHCVSTYIINTLMNYSK